MVDARAGDLLLGFAVLATVLVGWTPLGGLPAWMYPAQTPPPLHGIDPNRSGLHWPDLAFPVLAFGAGVTLAAGGRARLQRGERHQRVLSDLLKSGSLLWVLAVFSQHLNPAAIGHPLSARSAVLCLGGFACLCLALMRTRGWPLPIRIAASAAGWCGLFIVCNLIWYSEVDFLAAMQDAQLRKWSWEVVTGRSDLVLATLGQCVFWGGWAWVATRESVARRRLILAAIAGLWLALDRFAPLRSAGEWSPAPRLVHWTMLPYLAIFVAGTIAADVAAWRRNGTETGGDAGRPSELGGENSGPIIRLMVAGAIALSFAIVLHRFDQPVRREPATAGYFVAALGAGMLSFAACLGTCAAFARWRGPSSIVAAVGRNPIVALFASRDLLVPVLVLSGADVAMSNAALSAWAEFGVACGKVALLAVCVRALESVRVNWRW